MRHAQGLVAVSVVVCGLSGPAYGQSNFKRGDANGDGTVDISDAIVTLAVLFLGEGELRCDDAGDSNDDGLVDVSDPINTLGFLFLGEKDLPPPGPGDCGPDPTDDTLACESYSHCPQGPPNRPPAITSLPPLEGKVGREYRYAIVAVDPDKGDELVFGLESGPASAEIDPRTGVVRWTPEAEGDVLFTVVAQDLGGLVAEQLWVVEVVLPPPAPPSLDPLPEVTADATIEVSGSVEPSSEVRIVGGLVAEVTTSDGAGRFAAAVSLQPNRENRLFVSVTDPDGRESAPISAQIIQDGEPPQLFIDEPKDGGESTNEMVTVVGRVGDRLSGFMGLQVEVNGRSANVVSGQGMSGTFELSHVMLDTGENTITATATDFVGNTRETSVTLARRIIEPESPRIEVLSGNGQIGPVFQELPEPIAVRILESEAGPPLARKLVTFYVSRSDGRLAADPFAAPAEKSMRLLVRTDDQGIARAYWTMGTDAGCGNNRVTVSSTDIDGATVFCATAIPGPATQINIGSGESQRVEVDSPAPEPLQVRVSDGCNGVAGVPVTFTVGPGVGLVNGETEVTVLTSMTGHAEVLYTAGPEAGNQHVSANFEGHRGEAALFTVHALDRINGAETRFAGVVLDNAMQPIGGVACLLWFPGSPVLEATTNVEGQFTFAGIEYSGPANFYVDGLQAASRGGEPIEEGSFPALSYQPVIVPNAENALSAPVVLPPLDPRNAREYSTEEETVLGVEGIEGLEMRIAPGSMRLADGTPAPAGTIVTLNQVHHYDVPMPMPDGAAPPFAWTLQPAGATFDPPVAITYPNMSGLPAGAVSYFLTFDHDLGEFEIVGTGRVRDDGAEIVSDPGSGLPLAGWGCNCPPYAVTGSCEANCSQEGLADGVGAGTTWYVYVCSNARGFVDCRVSPLPPFCEFVAGIQHSLNCRQYGDLEFRDRDTANQAQRLCEIENGKDGIGGGLSSNSSVELLVTAGGRSVRADADGSFFVANVPAPDLNVDFLSDDFIRVVGVTTLDGETRYALSTPFQIESGKTFMVDELTITTSPPPLPESIALSIDAPVLPTGATGQLMATGFPALSDPVDITSSTQWTTYRTSNPAIATVDRDGLVTAISPGRAIITAVNDGASATARVTVVADSFDVAFEGFARREDGSPAAGAEVVSNVGGSVLADAEGFFSLPVTVGPDVTVTLTASLASGERTLRAARVFDPVAGSGPVDAGIITIARFPLADVVEIPIDGPRDLLSRPRLAFSDAENSGLLVWDRFGGGPNLTEYSHWDGLEWSSAQGTGVTGSRVRSPTLAFRPGANEALLVIQCCNTDDDIYYQTWRDGGWSSPVLFAGGNDDDCCPAFGFLPSGDAGLLVWGDGGGFRGVSSAVWDAVTGTWPARLAVHPSIPGFQTLDTHLAYDPITAQWVITYSYSAWDPFNQQLDGFEIYYHVATMEDGRPNFGAQVRLTDNEYADRFPLVSFRSDGAGAIFSDTTDGLNGVWIARWNGAGFDVPERYLEGAWRTNAVLPGERGWHVVLRELETRELHHLFYTGDEQSELRNLMTGDGRFASLARDANGNLHMAWDELQDGIPVIKVGRIEEE